MTTCDGCKFAEWKRTKNGRLHPDKSGRCTWDGLDLRLPAAFYWVTSSENGPRPSGGYIERGQVHKKPCIFKDGSKSTET